MAGVGTLRNSGRCQRIAHMTIDRRELRIARRNLKSLEMLRLKLLGTSLSYHKMASICRHVFPDSRSWCASASFFGIPIPKVLGSSMNFSKPVDLRDWGRCALNDGQLWLYRRVVTDLLFPTLFSRRRRVAPELCLCLINARSIG